MNLRTLSATLALSIAAVGCAASTPPALVPPPKSTADVASGPAVRALELPTATGAEPREVRVLLEQPGLKLAAIALRAGTVLPPHDAPVAVTIVAVSGSGTLVSGAERLRLDPGHAVALAPGVPHAVEPDPGSDLVILVHHLGSDAGHAARAAHATHEAHP